MSAIAISTEDIEASTFYLCLRTSPSSKLRFLEVVGAAITRPIASAYRVAPASEGPNHGKDDSVTSDLIRFGEDDTALFCS